jgi:hypothetical protein
VRLSPNQPDPNYFSNLYIPDGNSHDPWNTRNFTGFDKGYSTITGNFLNTMTSAFPIKGIRQIVPVLGFIVSPDDITTLPPDGMFYEDVTSIGKELFQQRLSQLLNTLFLAGIQPSIITGDMSITEKLQKFITSTITAETRRTERILECNKAWFSIILVISIIILVISLSGAILRAITMVPDVLGTLSMITLDNHCDKELLKASMLNGLERSRLLKKVSIKLGNVKQNSPSGRIGFSAPARDEDVAELFENGLYE